MTRLYKGKRLFDFIFSLIGVSVFAPVWAISALAIFIKDGSPIIFRQERVGLNKKLFVLLKLRTMDDSGNVTSSGRWLRATGIDESLQFLSVLKGDMSIVGPRPMTASDLVKLGWTGDHLGWRWIRPGITGPAQLTERCLPHVV